MATNPVLRLLTTEKKLIIKATDGKKTLAQAKDTFNGFIDPKFKNRGLDNPGVATPDTPIDMYEVIADATFKDMFCSLSGDLDKLCLTQSQIEEFCRTNNDLLQGDVYGMFFLFREDYGYFLVARVCINSGGLAIYYNRFDHWPSIPGIEYVWGGDRFYRVIVPAGVTI